jgi:hypothetical protein
MLDHHSSAAQSLADPVGQAGEKRWSAQVVRGEGDPLRAGSHVTGQIGAMLASPLSMF